MLNPNIYSFFYPKMFYSSSGQWILVFIGYPKPVIHLFLKIIYYTLSVNLIFKLPYLTTSPAKSTPHPLFILTSISNINSMTPLNNLFSLILFYPNVKKKFHFKTKVPFLCLPFIKKWI